MHVIRKLNLLTLKNIWMGLRHLGTKTRKSPKKNTNFENNCSQIEHKVFETFKIRTPVFTARVNVRFVQRLVIEWCLS